jgi:hypothetical protein
MVVADLGSMAAAGSGGLVGAEDESMEGLRGVGTGTGTGEGCELRVFMGMVALWIF